MILKYIIPAMEELAGLVVTQILMFGVLTIFVFPEKNMVMPLAGQLMSAVMF